MKKRQVCLLSPDGQEKLSAA